MNRKITTFVSTLALFSSMASHTLSAQEDSSFAAGVVLGTTGAGIELGMPLTEAINLRGSYNTISYDTDFDDTNVSYNADFNKDSLGLLLDWHPLGNGFRLSGGVYSHSDNNVDILAVASSTATYTINNTVYDATNIGSVNGTVDFEKTTPYFGIGWGSVAGSTGFTFTLDLGVQFQDTPTVGLTANGCTLPGTLCTQLTSDLQVEVAEVQADAEDFDMWPVLNLGMRYRF